jgi:hypothetical protein
MSLGFRMERFFRFALSYYFFAVGLFLLFAPWTPLWSRNWFISRTGPLSEVLLSAWTRGALSGVGVLYMLVGLRDTLLMAIGRKE